MSDMFTTEQRNEQPNKYVIFPRYVNSYRLKNICVVCTKWDVLKRGYLLCKFKAYRFQQEPENTNGK